MPKSVARTKFVAYLGGFVFTLSLCRTPGLIAKELSYGNLMDHLASGEFSEATKALTELYELGEASIPHVISGFNDTRRFHGVCGYYQFHPTWEFYPAENYKTPGPTEREICEVQIRDVCLYLLLAIQKKDLYHAEVCRLTSEEPDKEKAILQALEEISVKYQDSLTDTTTQFDLLSVEKILITHKIKFQ